MYLRTQNLVFLARLVLPLCVLSCTGEIGDGAVDPEANVEMPEVTEPEAAGPAFALSLDRVRLLPFRARLSRLADTVDIDESDTLFDTFRDFNTDLGDHDYAAGVAPDAYWSSTRMHGWSEALLPVCDSTQIRQRYPSFPDSLPDLLETAYGREPSDDDLALFDEIYETTILDDDGRYRMTCLVVLSSAEFVSQ